MYGILWFLVLMIVSAMAYQRHQGQNASIFTAVDAVAHLKVYYWLNPVTWGSCIKWTIIYWVGIGMFMIYEQKWKHDAAGIEAGSAHWNDDVEGYNQTHTEPFGEKYFSDEPGLTIGGKNLNNPLADPIPGNPNMIMSQTVRLSTADMKTHVNNNVLVVGGAGSGKSRFFIKPNILQMNCSFIVTDPSGELLKSTRNVLVENGYRIKVFNLVDMKYSCKYNPFRYIRTETDVSILVDCFISNTTAPDAKGYDPFWDKSEKALLSALIFYLVDIAEDKFKKFSTILWMLQLAQMDENINNRRQISVKPNFDFSVDTPLDELFNGTKKIAEKAVKDKNGRTKYVLAAVDVTDPKEQSKLQEKLETSLSITNYKTFKLGGVKTLKSILISAAVRLNPFSIPAVQNLTGEDNVNLDEVGDELTAFFCIIPQTNNTFNFLVSMLFSQMFETLYYKGTSIPNSRLRYHVRFLLDEFANVGKIPEFPQKISTCRKYNISITIVLQTIPQIKMLYKDDFETIIGNCDTSICLGTNEQTSADYFSKKLGKTTITARNKSTQIGKSGGSLSFNQTGRELKMADEIMTMSFEDCIVTMNHVSPFFDKKYKLEDHPQYMKTGDGDPNNFYFLEKDEEFLCVDNEEEVNDFAVEESFEDTTNEKYQPKSLEEVLGDLLLNVPDEDGYYLIKDEDSDMKASVFGYYKKKLEAAINQCIDEKSVTIFFNGGNMDILLSRPFINKVMNQYENIDDVVIVCDGITEGHVGFVGSRSRNSNAVKVSQKLGFILEPYKDQDSSFIVYKIKENITEDKLNEFKNGCIHGEEAIIKKSIFDDDDLDYEDW